MSRDHVLKIRDRPDLELTIAAMHDPLCRMLRGEDAFSEREDRCHLYKAFLQANLVRSLHDKIDGVLERLRQPEMEGQPCETVRVSLVVTFYLTVIAIPKLFYLLAPLRAYLVPFVKGRYFDVIADRLYYWMMKVEGTDTFEAYLKECDQMAAATESMPQVSVFFQGMVQISQALVCLKGDARAVYHVIVCAEGLDQALMPPECKAIFSKLKLAFTPSPVFSPLEILSSLYPGA